ncbi:MAG: hypothetical protein KC413_09200 [Anaerolineales bacterium]|nr:hypothetical protein [Anaerolineales bacterium]
MLDEEVQVTIDLFGLMTGTYSLEPDVSFPDRGIELRSIQPAQVTVEITTPLTFTNELSGTILMTGTTATVWTLPDITASNSELAHFTYFQTAQAAALPNFNSFSKRILP